MESILEIFKKLSAGPLCSFTCSGIFSRLSNEGKQSPALIYFSRRPERGAVFLLPGSITLVLIFSQQVFRAEPVWSMPSMDFCFVNLMLLRG